MSLTMIRTTVRSVDPRSDRLLTNVGKTPDSIRPADELARTMHMNAMHLLDLGPAREAVNELQAEVTLYESIHDQFGADITCAEVLHQ